MSTQYFKHERLTRAGGLTDTIPTLLGDLLEAVGLGETSAFRPVRQHFPHLRTDAIAGGTHSLASGTRHPTERVS